MDRAANGWAEQFRNYHPSRRLYVLRINRFFDFNLSLKAPLLLVEEIIAFSLDEDVDIL